ncbi:MAG: hypothetical protein U5K75_11290, partial [Ahrensia sp.]|nr:hypothetical protein [Ahrensia sp.]
LRIAVCHKSRRVPVTSPVAKPRVADLFEARKPKEHAILAEISGVVSFGKETKGKKPPDYHADDCTEAHEELIPKWRQINVFEGDPPRRMDAHLCEFRNHRSRGDRNLPRQRRADPFRVRASATQGAPRAIVHDGKAYPSLEKPCLVAVDIDGQMDGQDTGKGYKGSPIHTISIFANPPLEGKPKPGDPRVLTVKPGRNPAFRGGRGPRSISCRAFTTSGVAFPPCARTVTTSPAMRWFMARSPIRKWGEARNIRIFGHGTLSVRG